MKTLTHKPTVSNLFRFQSSKPHLMHNSFGPVNRTILMAVVLALICSALPVLAQGNNQRTAVSVLENNSNRTVIRYEFGDFLQQQVVIEGQIYNAIFLKSESNKKKVGEPELPDVSRSVIIPDDAEMQVNVIDSSYYEIEDFDVVPSKGYISRAVNPADVPYTFGDAYQTDAFCPGPLAQLREPYIMRDHRGIVITANPFQYNPVSRVLRVYTDMTIEVVSAGVGKVNVLHRKPRKLSRAFHQLYSSHFINYDLAQRYTPLDETGEMLIIVHDAWNTNVQPLKTHKDSIGITTTIKNVSTIPGGNTAASIKSYIQSVYDSATDLAFVLLVGDLSQVDSSTAVSGYNGESDPKYSKLAGGDDYPDIIVGRLSAESAADVDTQVLRTIEYENLPATNQTWFWKGTGIASDDGTGSGDDSEWDWEHMRNIRTGLLGYSYTAVDELYEGSQGGEDAPGDPTAGMVSTSVNAGLGIINYCGHGSVTSWGTTSFSTTNVNALTNDNMLPFIFDIACLNGDFGETTCFAEAWMRATNGTEPTGAIGIYASSINQPWNPPMEAQDEFNALYVVETYDYYGTYCYAGSCSMMDDYPGNGETYGSGPATFNTWHIFGDPSLRIVGDDVNTPPAEPNNPDPNDGAIDVLVDTNLAWNVPGTPGTTGSLTTTFAGGNGHDGNMFDLTAKETIMITGWEGNIDAGGGSATIEVYYVTDHTSFVGKETNPALWTLLGSVTLTSTNPAGTPTVVAIGGLTIASGETVGIYWTTTASAVDYTNGSLGVFENAELRFEDRGTGNAYPFGSMFSPRIWNGTIHYETSVGSDTISNVYTTWDVYFGTENPPTALVCADLTDPTCDPGLLQYCTTYFWQVVAKSSCGETPGETWSFTTRFADMVDLELFVSHWLDTDCSDSAGDESDWCFGTDLDKSTVVDFSDYARLTVYWLECSE